MSYTREEWLGLNEKNRKKSLNGERPHMEYLVQAQVKMSYLTGVQEWDIFLSYLQSALDTLKLIQAEKRNALCSPSLVDTNSIMEVKLDLAEVTGQINLLEGVLALPKDIMESGERAKALLG
jgi:hypothetical protein